MPISLDGSGSISGISTFSFSDEIIHTGDTNTAIKFPANDTISFETSGAERLRIDSSGRVLIGTTTSAYKLCVADNTNASLVSQLVNTNTGSSTKSIFQIQTGSNRYVNFENDYTGQYIHVVGSGISTYFSSFDTHRFRNNSGTERFTITSDGKIGIGIAAPTSKLYVNGVSTNDVITARAADTNGTSVINILAEGTTGHSRIKFSDTAGTDGQISYSHSTRELKLNSAGADRLTFGINAFNSPVFNLGVSSSDSNNHNKGDRTSVKVGDYLNIESPRGAGHNGKAGIGYNCYFHSGEDFYCGTNSPSSGDNRPAAYGMGFGNHYFYSDASNTAHSAQAQLTMAKNMVIHRQGYVTKPNQPSFLVAPANDSQTANGYGVYTTVFHNTGSHYSTSTGRFTAPVTGYYNFGANYVGAAACENVFVRFYINGAVNQRGQHYSGGGNAWGTGSPYMSCDLSATHTLLQAGDYVNVHLQATGATQGQSGYMRFYGYLVH